jgi:hypothetical protein
MTKWELGGHELRRLRMEMGFTQEEVLKMSAAVLAKPYSDDRYIRKLEAGDRRPRRYHLISWLTSVLNINDIETVDRVLALYGYGGLTQTKLRNFPLRMVQIKSMVLEKFPQMEEGICSVTVEFFTKDGTMLMSVSGWRTKLSDLGQEGDDKL